MESVALYNFEAVQFDELSFTKTNIIKVLDMNQGSNWYFAELNGKLGYIPCNYIRIQQTNWFQPKVSRRKAEELLLEMDPITNSFIQPDGAFLVRKSELINQGFSLSVKINSRISHYKILHNGRGKYCLWDVCFDSINLLINYYKENLLIQSTEGPVKLVDKLSTAKFPDITYHHSNKVIAIMDFTPNHDDHYLKLEKGDVLETLTEIKSCLVVCRNLSNGNLGIVHKSFIQKLNSFI